MRTDVYQGTDEHEAFEAYFERWLIDDAPVDRAYQPLWSDAFEWGWNRNVYFMDRDFWAPNRDWQVLEEAHTAGLRAYDEWTEGN